jgi:hypothetical protein
MSLETRFVPLDMAIRMLTAFAARFINVRQEFFWDRGTERGKCAGPT